MILPDTAENVFEKFMSVEKRVHSFYDFCINIFVSNLT